VARPIPLVPPVIRAVRADMSLTLGSGPVPRPGPVWHAVMPRRHRGYSVCRGCRSTVDPVFHGRRRARQFGRAADALRTAQPSLSRQIQRLEKTLGVRLFERTGQGTHLTPAGRAFLPEAYALLGAADRAAVRARAAARPGTLTIGYTGNLPVTADVRAFRARHPEAVVHSRHLDSTEVHPALTGHQVDVAVARLPFPTGGLTVTPLYEHGRVLVVPRSHRLAGKESVCLEDFADEPLVRCRDLATDAFWRIDPRPGGRPAPDGPTALSLADKLELVAGGDALTMAPDGDPATLRADLIAIPVHGVESCHVVIATRPGPSLLIDDFRALLSRPA
jgi:DNA-binding transcriptional LysR family regulator